MSSQAMTNESKPVHAMHFKCELCKKKYATEASVINHIEKYHDHISPSHTQEYYSSFVATKRARAPADQTPRMNDKVNSSQLLAFKCGLCETYLRSSKGIAIHVEVAHGIKGDMIKEAYSVSAIPRSVLPLFVPPTKSVPIPTFFKVESKSSSMTSPSIEPQNNEESNPAELSKEIPSLASDKKASIKTHKIKSKTAGHGQQKVKKKGVGFCKTLSNMFAKGMIPVENLWKNTNSPISGLKSEKSMKSSPSELSQDIPSKDILRKDILSQDILSEDILSKDILRKDILSKDFLTIDILSKDSLSEANRREDDYKKPRNKVFRRRKSCTVETCEPCSLSADCMKCRNCLNKNLK